MTVQEAIQTRRSIRKYTDEPMSDSDIVELVRLAGLAPSSSNVQPWRVAVVRDADHKRDLRKACMDQAQVEAAAAAFVVYEDMDDAVSRLEAIVHPGVGPERVAETARGLAKHFSGLTADEMHEWGRGQTYIFLGFLLVAATAMGFGSSAMLGFEPDRVKALLDLPESSRIAAVVALGRSAEEGFPHHRWPVDEILTIKS